MEKLETSFVAAITQNIPNPRPTHIGTQTQNNMSRPAQPSPAHAASSAHSQLSSVDWLRCGFIHDKFSSHCSRAQGSPFLRTGVRPAIGQRVELSIFLSSDNERRGQMPFRLSGEVVDDRHACDALANHVRGGGGRMGVSEEDTEPSFVTVDKHDGASSMGISHYHSQISSWRPSTSSEDCGVDGGSVSLAHMVRSLIIQQHPHLDIAPEHLTSAWKTMSEEKKDQVSTAIVKKLGVVHGQKVLCEGR